MSLIPSFFGKRRNTIFDPFSLDVWDPFKDFPLSSPSGLSNETSALVNARVDWKETPEAHKEDKNDKWHRVERSNGKFTRRFRLPENAKMDQIKAGMENGVLTITVPKEEVKKPDVKSIQISG
ncbi:HSP20-like chaperone [Artemisia annua]|uniref:HSP20-like chaperone n=1 Tax=Artemisia annua TaxID=35608 RepID=A0A2U1KFM9_ARTAN|nr:HSP20-like chaperone [Artemisia annua]